jgi:hypothetical protein
MEVERGHPAGLDDVLRGPDHDDRGVDQEDRSHREGLRPEPDPRPAPGRQEEFDGQRRRDEERLHREAEPGQEPGDHAQPPCRPLAARLGDRRVSIGKDQDQAEVLALAERPAGLDEQQKRPGHETDLPQARGKVSAQTPGQRQRNADRPERQRREDDHRREADPPRQGHDPQVHQDDHRRVGVDDVLVRPGAVEDPAGHVQVPRLVRVRRQECGLRDPGGCQERQQDRQPAGRDQGEVAVGLRGGHDRIVLRTITSGGDLARPLAATLGHLPVARDERFEVGQGGGWFGTPPETRYPEGYRISTGPGFQGSLDSMPASSTLPIL